ncbi:MAG TPA: DHA2 family efflux MFS transporter permease subunit [Candidatus Avipropionibacterium avicola]|uniref:DHA2 family efflux MFS transporter permease subunit n=1 Tax=Candidatus Avipropionibacterium avicola TaxID=2840701 RepID=A0A9D1KND4_9ACTN|nr:DHA2 family efflux MFS transporter permease subunit [Candidatus Avipropionibacterium avicola]
MPSTTTAADSGLLTGRARNLALTGLFLSMFVSMISMNVVGTSMPIIIADIGGTQASYTWVVVATMLASAIATPIWGKLADLTSKKVLVQIALVVFALGTILAGMAQDPTWLISCRILQGLGAGGLGALNQIVLAEIVSPRERGKYMGIMGAIMAVATVGGPLLGGTLTDTIGWRWNFYVGVPLAIAAIIMLQKTLHLHTERKKITIDYLGAVLISAGFSLILIWITLGGSEFDWASWQTAVMAGGGAILLVLAVLAELRAKEPMIPLTLFKNRTFTLSVIASMTVGIAMFATAVYLGQYMQLARGRSVIESSLLTLPMMLGVLGASTVSGQLISRYGAWKRYMVAGSIGLLVGLFMLGQLRYDTSYVYVGVSMFVLGCGVGMTMQNLVLVVQNTVAPNELGVASSSVNFFRTIGGSAGMSVMGTLLARDIADYLKIGITELAAKDPSALAGAEALQNGTIPRLADLPEALRLVVESAYGHAIGNVFLAVTPLAVVAIVAIAFLPNLPLSTQTNAERMAEMKVGPAAEAESPMLVAATTGPGVPIAEPNLVADPEADPDNGEFRPYDPGAKS